MREYSLDRSKLSNRCIRDISKTPPDETVNQLLASLSGAVRLNPTFNHYSNLWNFDWRNLGQDNNWWWKVQQLPSLEWSSYDLSKLESKHLPSIVELNGQVINDWSQNCMENKTIVPYAWNDLATAFRAKNLYLWGSWLIANNESPEQIKILKGLLVTHVEWLVQEKNWSKGTNHGLFQSKVLLEISQGWPTVFGRNIPLALTRLEHEIKQQFTEEGVHVENSPGYHKPMVSRLQEIKSSLDEVGLRLTNIEFSSIIDGASKFSKQITLPSGKLPLIGDTQNRSGSESQNVSKSYGKFLWPKSGWFITRAKLNTKINQGKSDFHLIFKNQHLSHYHRHDDDLSVHIAIGDQTFIGDSGLLSYSERSASRQYIRSALAHSTLHPIGVEPKRRPSAGKENWLSSDNELRSVSAGTSNYQGFSLARTLVTEENGVLREIKDEIHNQTDKATQVMTAFIVPAGMKITHSSSGVSVGNNDYVLSITVSPSSKLKPDVIRVIRGIEGHPHAILSETYGIEEPCQRIELISKLSGGSTGATTLMIRIFPAYV